MWVASTALPAMPDTRKNRGANPTDDALFSSAQHPLLRRACADLSWLLSHRYAMPSALKLVGDRYDLTARQRKAVERGTCTELQRASRVAKRHDALRLKDARVCVDTFNVIITSESALGGAPVFIGQDTALRDLAGVHGHWRRVHQTAQALASLSGPLSLAREVTFVLDRPVSNSGRLATWIRAYAAEHALPWHVFLSDRADEAVIAHGGIIASADARILDACDAWVDLPAIVVRQTAGAYPAYRPWLVDLRTPAARSTVRARASSGVFSKVDDAPRPKCIEPA